jgi:hypothetical protein
MITEMDKIRHVLEKHNVQDYKVFTRHQNFAGSAPIIAAHWTDVEQRMGKYRFQSLMDFIQKSQVLVENLDSVDECCTCGQCLVTDPDYSNAIDQYFLRVGFYEPGDGLALMCQDCVHSLTIDEREEQVIHDYVDEYETAVPKWMERLLQEEHGFTPYADLDYVTGIDVGRDKPIDVYEEIKEEFGDAAQVVFILTNSGPFRTYWNAMYRIQ